MSSRSFPLSPRSTQPLEAGDLIAVPCEPSGWACLQVIELQRTGAGSRTTFVAGVLPWHGAEPPTQHSVSGLHAVEQGLTPIEVFTEGGLQVVDAGQVVSTDLSSNFQDFSVGAQHKVWGWRTAIRKAQSASS